MGVTPVAKRSCGTCRDRRVLCDRTTPSCSQCARSNRKCKGYGIRLSWPRANDARRAVILDSTLHKAQKKPRCNTSDASLIHTSTWDIEMHYHMLSNTQSAPVLHIHLPWNPSGVKEKGWDLLVYFQSAASSSLTTFGHDPKYLGDVLTRVALSDNTPAARAVLNSLLGLSSLHRYGFNEQAMEFKVSSLRALAAASQTDLGQTEGIYHVAAGMLLCSFEVQQASCTASEWTWYLNGIKDVLNAHCFSNLTDTETTVLVNWVQYHDVMTRFSIRHWNGGPQLPNMEFPFESSNKLYLHLRSRSIDLILCDRWRESQLGSPIADLMTLIGDICDTVPAKPCYDILSSQELEEYKGRLRDLDWRIRNIPLLPKNNSDYQTRTILHLYQLAMLIYLNRSTGDILNKATQTQAYIAQAFKHLSSLLACERHFPLYIIGWEAKTDEQRKIVLELLDRTRKKPSSTSLYHVERILHAIWAQDDLATEELNYWDKVTSIISSCSILPSFV